MRHCTYCRHEVGVILWVFDGVTDYPIPCCQACKERIGLKVFRVEMDDEMLAGVSLGEDTGASVDEAPDAGAGAQPT